MARGSSRLHGSIHKRTRVNSVGSKHLLAQAKKKPKNSEFHGLKTFTSITSLSNSDINKILTQHLENCCVKKNCFLKIFVDKNNNYQFDEAINKFRECRDKVNNISKASKDSFIISLIKDSIISKQELENGEYRFVHDWKFFDTKVCFKTISYAYSISTKIKDKCSDLLKKNSSITSLSNHRSYTDSTLHNYTYNESNVLFNRVEGFGKFIL
jgi:hypothetical protein